MLIHVHRLKQIKGSGCFCVTKHGCGKTAPFNKQPPETGGINMLLTVVGRKACIKEIKKSYN